MSKKKNETPRNKTSQKPPVAIPNPEQNSAAAAISALSPLASRTSASDREQRVTEALKRIASLDGPMIVPTAADLTLGSRDESLKVRISVLRVNKTTGNLIEPIVETLDHDWDDGPISFGFKLSSVSGRLARRVWGMEEHGIANDGAASER